MAAAPASDDARDHPKGAGRPGPSGRPDDLARVRSFTRWSLIAVGVVTIGLPVADLVGRDLPPAAVAAAGVGLLIVGAEHVRLLLGAMGAVDERELLRPRVLAAGVVSLALLALLAPGDGPASRAWWALPFASLVGAAALWLPASARRWWIGGSAFLAAVVGSLAALAGGDAALGIAIAAVVSVVSVAFADVLQMWLWNVTVRLDEARSTAGELAVLRERLRFAADLHDVQGHHLQAISLKAELTRRLIGTDDDAARGHAADVQDLTLSALAETRGLVRGYRKVGLVTELENAVQILRAAGVETAVTGTPEQVPDALQPLFGSLVREGATNLLRHARADRCTLSVELEDAHVVLRIQDDGTHHARDPTADPGTGVVALNERFAAVGGRVEAGALPERGFALTGRAPR